MGDLPFSGPPTDPLSKNNEEDTERTDSKHDTNENHSKFQKPISQNPGQHLVSHTKRQQRFSGNEDGDQFGCVTIVAINHVRDQHGKADKVGELEDCVASEEADPMELVVRCTGEHCETNGGTHDCWKKTPETHLGFSDTVVLSCAPCGKTIADGADGDGQQDTEKTADIVEARLFLRPIPRGCRDEDGETEPDIQCTETDSHAVKDDGPQNCGIDEEGELTP